MYITNFKLDDSKSSNEPYISKRDSTNLLNTMLGNENSRIKVTECFIDSLIKPGKKSFATDFHVNWAMECIGYAFSLPIEHYNTITHAIFIYKGWLLNPKQAPQCFKSNLEYYRREILGHLTLVFRRKKDARKQAELCSDVLNLIQAFIRTQGIEEETWMCLIKLLLLTLNQTLTNYRELADYLSSKLIKVFFEVLLRSNSRADDLWKESKCHMNEWIDHYCVISHWSAVVQALTVTVINLVYGEPKKNLEIMFTASGKLPEDPETLALTLTDEQSVYFWRRFLDLILVETKNNIKLIPDLHTILSRSIVSIIDQFLEICTKRIQAKPMALDSLCIKSSSEQLSECLQKCYDAHFNYVIGVSRLPMPSINSILDVFGTWLFYHAQVVPAYDAFGKSEVISVLCRLFAKAQGPAKKEYLSIFYSILLESIAHGDQRVIGEMLKNSTELIATDMIGVDFILRPDGYIQHLALYLEDKDTEMCIRYPCYKILAIFAALPNAFKLTELSKHVVEIFLSALGLETENENFYLLVWSMCTFAASVRDNKDILHSILCAMVDRIGSIDYKEKVIYNHLLEAITILPHIITRTIVSTQVVLRNITNLHAFIPKRGKSTEDDQTSGLLIALCNWLICFPAVFQDYELRFDILKAIENRRNIEKFRVLAECVRGTLLNNLQRPRCDQPGINMASMKHQLTAAQRRHYVNGNSLISFYEGSGTKGITARNPVGMYEWKLKMITSKFPKPQTLTLPIYPSNRGHLSYTKSKHDIAEDLYLSLSEEEQNIFLIQDKLFKSQKLVKNLTPAFNPKPIIWRTSMLKIAPHFHRVFLSQLGLLEPENIGKLIPIPMETASEHIEAIDRILEKEYIIFPVFYLSTPEDKEKAIISRHSNFTKQFQNFLNNLGVVLAEPENKLKHLSGIITKFDKIIYKSCTLFESIVIAPALFSSNKFNFLGLVSRFPVIVLWNQRANDPCSKKIPNIIEYINQETTIVIVLSCISDHLLRVNIYGGKKKTGPLLDQMIVPDNLLPKLLQVTIYNYSTSIATYTSSTEKRNSLIREHQDQKVDLEKMMNYLFN